MASPQMVMYEEEFAQVQAVTDRLVQDANARVVFVVDKNGQLIAEAGATCVDGHLDERGELLLGTDMDDCVVLGDHHHGRHRGERCRLVCSLSLG